MIAKVIPTSNSTTMALFPFSASVLSIVSITMELNKLFAHAQRGETLPLGLLEFTLSLVYNGYTLVLLIILTSQTRCSKLCLYCPDNCK